MASALQQRLAERLNLKPIGHYYYGLCPFHNDHTPSFLLYPDYFICKSASCGKKGNINYLEGYNSLAPTRSISAKKSTRILPRWKQWEKRYGDMEGIVIKAHQNVLGGGDGYFRRRKIDQFIQQGKFGLLDGWALFPVTNAEGRIIDIVVRAIRQEGMKYVIRPYSENELRPLYVPNWERTLKNDYIYVVFGIITAWALEAIGEPVVTGITGKSLNPELLKQFQKPIIVVPDWNEEKDGVKLVNQLGWRGSLKIIDWPENTEDLDDIRRFYSDDVLKDVLYGKNPS